MLLEAGTRSAERRDNGDGLAEDDDRWDVSRIPKRSYIEAACSNESTARATTPRRDSMNSEEQQSEEHTEKEQAPLSPESMILEERLLESMVRTDELLT